MLLQLPTGSFLPPAKDKTGGHTAGRDVDVQLGLTLTVVNTGSLGGPPGTMLPIWRRTECRSELMDVEVRPQGGSAGGSPVEEPPHPSAGSNPSSACRPPCDRRVSAAETQGVQGGRCQDVSRFLGRPQNALI
ncbi:hypothetical protein NHX12_032129 [Muraenolepis orangiensis]|uniref:Uncharacterized protein n=1 Tax=Muraenolepis orangiensis TaxID=630683 RepID=A0A9Q0E8C5_9TELE|nr:hypothetical protein NHX12_032129 [Muraenolepis orangiensis]